MLDIKASLLENNEEEIMPSLNHSYIVRKIILQIEQDNKWEAYPELTLDIGNGLIPDLSIYRANVHKIDFQEDIVRYDKMPIIAVEVLSPGQNQLKIQEKAKQLIQAGCKSVLIVDIFTQTVVVISQNDKKVIHNDMIKIGDIEIDFREIFS